MDDEYEVIGEGQKRIEKCFFLRRSIEKLILIAGSELSVRLVVVGESEI